MLSGSCHQGGYAGGATPRRRAVALLAALAANLLLVLLLLRLAPAFQPPPTAPDVVTLRLLPTAKRHPADATASRAKRTRSAAETRPSRKAAHVEHPPVPTHWPAGMIIMNREDYAASDIARLPSHPLDHPTQSADAGASGQGREDGTAAAGGGGSGGNQLYDADWYRRPTRAELATYLPADAPPTGWGMVACRTVERYHVDDCRELADSPPGSGLARAVREAAWQFLVMPPRINGRPLIGAWVRIRIEYTETSIR